MSFVHPSRQGSIQDKPYARGRSRSPIESRQSSYQQNGYEYSQSSGDSDLFWEARRRKREALQGEYVKGVWARSPSPPAWARRDMEAAKRRALGEENSGSHASNKDHRHREDEVKDTNKNREAAKGDDQIENKVSETRGDKNNKDKSDSEGERHKKKHSSKDTGSKRHHKSKRHNGKSHSSDSDSDSNKSDNESGGEEEEEWVETEVIPATGKKRRDDQDDIVGPRMPDKRMEVRMEGYNKAMLPGEAEAMAAYVAENKRIPRRGEIGLTIEEISHYENEGYVMSGSRHRRMEAVRLRKESQLYSAEERRALAMFNYEEKMKKEKQLMADFREQVQKKLRDQETKN